MWIHSNVEPPLYKFVTSYSIRQNSPSLNLGYMVGGCAKYSTPLIAQGTYEYGLDWCYDATPFGVYACVEMTEDYVAGTHDVLLIKLEPGMMVPIETSHIITFNYLIGEEKLGRWDFFDGGLVLSVIWDKQPVYTESIIETGAAPNWTQTTTQSIGTNTTIPWVYTGITTTTGYTHNYAGTDYIVFTSVAQTRSSDQRVVYLSVGIDKDGYEWRAEGFERDIEARDSLFTITNNPWLTGSSSLVFNNYSTEFRLLTDSNSSTQLNYNKYYAGTGLFTRTGDYQQIVPYPIHKDRFVEIEWFNYFEETTTYDGVSEVSTYIGDDKWVYWGNFLIADNISTYYLFDYGEVHYDSTTTATNFREVATAINGRAGPNNLRDVTTVYTTLNINNRVVKSINASWFHTRTYLAIEDRTIELSSETALWVTGTKQTSAEGYCLLTFSSTSTSVVNVGCGLFGDEGLNDIYSYPRLIKSYRTTETYTEYWIPNAWGPGGSFTRDPSTFTRSVEILEEEPNTFIESQLSNSTRLYILLEEVSGQPTKISLVTIEGYTLDTIPVENSYLSPPPEMYRVSSLNLKYEEVLWEGALPKMGISETWGDYAAINCAIFPADNCNGFAGFFNSWDMIHQLRLIDGEAYIYTCFGDGGDGKAMAMEFKFNETTQNIEFQRIVSGILHPPLLVPNGLSPSQVTYTADSVKLVI